MASIIFACESSEKVNAPDVSDIAVDVDIRRFEQALFSLDTNNMAAELKNLEEQFPTFAPIYFGQVMRVRGSEEEAADYIKGFITFPAAKALYDTCSTIFGEMADLQEAYRSIFQYYQYYFPDRPTPDVTTFISEYSIGSFIYGEDQLAVGLDFFLGNDYPYMQYNPNNPNFSNYLTRSFDKQHLPAKSLKPLLQELVGQASGQNLLDMMINEGKQLYILDLLMPSTADSVKLDLPQAKVDWLNASERQIWAYLLKDRFLYNSTYREIRRFVEYSPNIPAMHPEAPGRTGNWMGWKIIEAYMKNNPEISITDLIANQDAQQILDQSKYKPPR